MASASFGRAPSTLVPRLLITLVIFAGERDCSTLEISLTGRRAAAVEVKLFNAVVNCEGLSALKVFLITSVGKAPSAALDNEPRALGARL